MSGDSGERLLMCRATELGQLAWVGLGTCLYARAAKMCWKDTEMSTLWVAHFARD